MSILNSAKVGGDTRSKQLSDFLLKYAIYIVFVLLVAVIAFKEPEFVSVENFRNILSMSSTRIIIALGVGGILITGGTDLSAGRQVGLAAVVSASMLQQMDYARRMYPTLQQLPLWVPILIAMIVCACIGLFNGFVVAILKVPPFIATLGTWLAVYGLNSMYFDRPPYGAQPIGGLDIRFTNLGSGFIGRDSVYSIPYIVCIAIIPAIATICPAMPPIIPPAIALIIIPPIIIAICWPELPLEVAGTFVPAGVVIFFESWPSGLIFRLIGD